MSRLNELDLRFLFQVVASFRDFSPYFDQCLFSYLCIEAGKVSIDQIGLSDNYTLEVSSAPTGTAFPEGPDCKPPAGSRLSAGL